MPDYARFCQMILNGGKLGNVRVLSPKSVALMTHDQLGKISPEQGFGLGFGVDGIKSPLEELDHPAGDLQLNHQVHVLAYPAITN